MSIRIADLASTAIGKQGSRMPVDREQLAVQEDSIGQVKAHSAYCNHSVIAVRVEFEL